MTGSLNVEPVLTAIRRHLWDAYRRAGAPYGDDDNGMRRWIAEQRLKRRTAQLHQREAELYGMRVHLDERMPHGVIGIVGARSTASD